MGEIFNKDAGIRPILTIQSVPEGINDVLTGNTTIGAGAAITFVITIFPSGSRLSLWNHLFSVAIDTNDSDHIFPAGASLSADQRKLRISQWIDWADSSDVSNIRVHKIRLENFDASSHTYYLYYKAYTFSSVGGST